MIRFFIVKQRTSRLVPGSVTAVLDFVEDPVSRYTDTEYSFSRIYTLTWPVTITNKIIDIIIF